MIARRVRSLRAHAQARVIRARDSAIDRPPHDERTAALLGIALGVSFAVCFATGLLSHLIQQPPGWFRWPPRPAGLYRITQGVHITTGLASIPLLLAKLWAVFPNLFRWPPVASAAHAVERLMLVPLVCGSVFMLFSGAANIAKWYPWSFPFPTVHYWVGWITIGALVTHLGAKAATTRAALSRHHEEAPAAPVAGAVSRRGYLGLVAGAVGFATLTTIGQTVRPLQRLALFAPRRPDIGPQGLPVNGLPTPAIRQAANDDAYRLRVVGDVATPMELTLEELRALPQRGARLPISCVEGWSADADWAGVRVRDLLALGGVPAARDVEVEVRSLQRGGSYGHSMLNNAQARDRDTLIALSINGEVLHLDHGFPCRLIGPNRPGVQQTKWVSMLTVRNR